MRVLPASHELHEAACELADRWTITLELAERVALLLELLRQETGLTWWPISGYRTLEEQDELRARGRPAAPDELSTHRTCPATGMDLWTSWTATNAVRATFGRLAVMSGLRWGGGSPVDPQTGIPSDWNHVDLGPRGGGSTL